MPKTHNSIPFLTALVASTLFSTFATAEKKAATITVYPDEVIAKTVSNRLLGTNIGLWYTNDQLGELAVNGDFKNWKPGIIRIPGGSWSDEYFWNGNGVRTSDGFNQHKAGPQGWQIDFSEYKPGFRINHDNTLHDFHGNTDVLSLHQFIQKQGTDGIVTVNAGTGSAKLAAEWVRWANITNQFNVKYWEIGNELEGSWEAGNTRPDGSKMDAKKYAQIYLEFAKAMKAVDPTIKIGGPTSASDSIPYVEELLKTAGEQVDFISFHTYPVDGRTKELSAIMDQASRLSGAVEKTRAWIREYQPKRADEIEIGITEWHIQVHETDNTCNIISALWSAKFIGEMFANRVDFANQWDVFSTTDHGGHGLFDPKSLQLTRGAYWAFWLWSNKLGKQLVRSELTGSRDLICYATMKDGKPALLIINQSRENYVPTIIHTKGNSFDSASSTEISYRNYVWDPYKQAPVWSVRPQDKSVEAQGTSVSLTLSPLSATVVNLGTHSNKISAATTSATPDILLPSNHPSDLNLETLLLLKSEGSQLPFLGEEQTVHINIQGPLKASQAKIKMDQPASQITLIPTGPGVAKITLTCGETSTTKSILIQDVKVAKKVLWTYPDKGQVEAMKSHFQSLHNRSEARRNEDVLEIKLDHIQPRNKQNYLLQINPLRVDFNKSSIAGVTSWVQVSDSLKNAPPGATLQIVMQSETNHWMLLKEIPLRDLSNKEGQPSIIEAITNDPDMLKAMSHAYSLIYLVKSPVKLEGSIYIDDLGFITRNNS